MCMVGSDGLAIAKAEVEVVSCLLSLLDIAGDSDSGLCAAHNYDNNETWQEHLDLHNVHCCWNEIGCDIGAAHQHACN